jgi:tRNA threonylcarbamoyl adenosine modification protein YeaZ
MSSGPDRPTAATGAPLLLALDTGSPVTSVAVARGETVLAHATHAERHSSEQLLTLMQAVLEECALRVAALDGIIALQGPGSFTGLRIGLATAWGLHQAIGVAATAVPSLDVLAAAATEDEAVAVIDALRGEWVAQPFRRDAGLMQPIDEPRRLTLAELERFAPIPLIGFGLFAIRESLPQALRPQLLEPSELATHALRRSALEPPDWNAETLTRPIYYRPPATR